MKKDKSNQYDMLPAEDMASVESAPVSEATAQDSLSATTSSHAHDSVTDETADADAAHKEETPGGHRRQWPSTVAMIASVALWILVFLLPQSSLDALMVQCWVMTVLAALCFVVCFRGRKVNSGASKVGMVVSGALLLFLIIGLVGSYFIDTMA